MNEREKHNASDTPERQAASRRDFQHRLAVLKAEVEKDFPGTIDQLEGGVRVILVTDTGYAQGLDSDIIRRLGGLAVLSSFYGTAVVFVNQNRIFEVGSGNRATS